MAARCLARLQLPARRAPRGGKRLRVPACTARPLRRSCGLPRACRRHFRGDGGRSRRGPALAEVTSGPAVCGGAGRAGPSAERAERSGAGAVRAGHGGAAAPLRTAGERRGGARPRARTAGIAAGGSRAPPPPLRRCRAAASTPRGGAAPRYCLRRHPGPAGAAGAEQSGGGGGGGPAPLPPARGRAQRAVRPRVTDTELPTPGLPTTPQHQRRLRCYRNMVRLPGEGPVPGCHNPRLSPARGRRLRSVTSSAALESV